MSTSTPPPIPSSKNEGMALSRRFLIGFAIAAGVLVGLIFLLRVTGLVRPFSVPTGAMAPAVSSGDHVMMEGVTFLTRKPRRGDIIVFKTDGITSLPAGTFYVKRVAGEPGDRLRISDGKLYVSEQHVILKNSAGEISYVLPKGAESMTLKTDMTVPKGHYYVLGDNSGNSLDSRFWGSVPAENVLGRIAFCYWPPHRTGSVE